MRTRTSAPPSKKTNPDHEQQQPKTLTPAERPSKTFILPSTASEDARFVTLPNPRTGALNRYFFCPKRGVYEFTVVSSTPPRSVLFTSKTGNAPGCEGDASVASTVVNGSVSKAAELLVATPIDIVFFMIPLLSPTSTSTQKKLFQPLDDMIDSQDELPKHLRYVLYTDAFREVLQARVEAVCDTVEAGDEKLFRFNEVKLLKELIAKAERMVAHGLPASLEERFVRQALITPMVAVKRENPAAASNGSEGEEVSPSENQEAPSTSTPGTTNSDSATPSRESGESTPATEPVLDEQQPSSSPDDVVRLLRLSTALSFMKESCISLPLCTRLDEILASPESPVDFKPLQNRLQHIANLRAEALASRSLGDFSCKRGAEDDDAAETRAEKKRKEDEEQKKKKAGQSRGVKDLKKVNTGGMKKMSDFFGAAAAAKKKS